MNPDPAWNILHLLAIFCMFVFFIIVDGKRTAQAESKTSVCSSFTHVSAAQVINLFDFALQIVFISALNCLLLLDSAFLLGFKFI